MVYACWSFSLHRVPCHLILFLKNPSNQFSSGHSYRNPNANPSNRYKKLSLFIPGISRTKKRHSKAAATDHFSTAPSLTISAILLQTVAASEIPWFLRQEQIKTCQKIRLDSRCLQRGAILHRHGWVPLWPAVTAMGHFEQADSLNLREKLLNEARVWYGPCFNDVEGGCLSVKKDTLFASCPRCSRNPAHPWRWCDQLTMGCLEKDRKSSIWMSVRTWNDFPFWVFFERVL